MLGVAVWGAGWVAGEHLKAMGVRLPTGQLLDQVQIASARGEPLGLSFVGRGFDVRVGVPFNRSLEEAAGVHTFR